ncbi:MAG TPA: epoxyqueuosine reductase [Candidatus Hydrogenedentes bacterium]|nr:epoxyqueuosine reductase [Candidatus Hydrogenedentota bacterium]
MREALIAGGACLVGFADVSNLNTDVAKEYPFGICFALRYDRDAVEQLPSDDCFIQMSSKLSSRAKKLYRICTDILSGWGYRYKRITSATPADDLKDLSEELPQKTLATLSGLGWIGKSALLVSPEFGPRIRLGTILTHGALIVDAPITFGRCKDCTACVDACPAGAITGAEWSQGIARRELLDAFLCNQHLCETKQSLGRRQTCGICVRVCPFGRN